MMPTMKPRTTMRGLIAGAVAMVTGLMTEDQAVKALVVSDNSKTPNDHQGWHSANAKQANKARTRRKAARASRKRNRAA